VDDDDNSIQSVGLSTPAYDKYGDKVDANHKVDSFFVATINPMECRSRATRAAT